VHNHEQVLKAQKVLTEDFSRPPKVKDIARRTNISVSSLIRQFKAMYGKSLYSYYLEKKMDEAKKLMLQGLSVSKVAEAMGYKQPSAFISAFSKHFNHTPGELKLQSVRKR
jgi:AraC-like DNA-binding protein